MAEFDHNFAKIGDWMPSSPSPRTLFTAMLSHDSDCKLISELLGDVKTSGEAENMDSIQTGHLFSEGFVTGKKSSSYGGLSERIAARAGFNAPKLDTENIRSADFFMNTGVRSPYLAISPGFSPTVLLETPVFLSNSQVQPSPTTGRLPFAPDGNRSASSSKAPDKTKDDVFEDIDLSSFTFNPVSKSCSLLFLDTTTKITPLSITQHSFPRIEVSVESNNSLQSQSTQAKALNHESGGLQRHFFSSSAEKDNGSNTEPSDQKIFDTVDGNTILSQQLDDQHAKEDQGHSEYMMPSEDGYNWRKYGQKQVKVSEYPQSYYKCTHPNYQVKKSVEQSHEGHVTAIMYKGAHNHPKPLPNHKPNMASSVIFIEQPEQKNVAEGNSNVEMTSSAYVEFEHKNPSESLEAQIDPVDASSTFSNDEEEDDRARHGSVSLGCDGEGGDEPESKRRKIEMNATEMIGATRAIREPRVVVQTTSDVDIIDDGYRWRKYGQKVVKGNPNPRSYYKCTSPGCNVRKHVERASHDLKSVITTYEGKHNHEVPAARNSSQANSTGSNPQASSADQTGTSRFHSSIAGSLSDRFSSFSPLTLRQLLGLSPPGFPFQMNQPGISNILMAGHAKFPGLPVNRSPAYILPEAEQKMEPVSGPSSFNMSSGSSVYQEIMNRLALGPQM